MADILAAVTTLVTSAVSWTSSYLTMITGNQVLTLFCIALPLVGLGLGIIKRVVRVRM